jgi:hypothetical protein
MKNGHDFFRTVAENSGGGSDLFQGRLVIVFVVLQ